MIIFVFLLYIKVLKSNFLHVLGRVSQKFKFNLSELYIIIPEPGQLLNILVVSLTFPATKFLTSIELNESQL